MIQSQIHQADLYHVPLTAIYTNIHTALDFIKANYETFITGGCSILRPCVSDTDFEQFDREHEFLRLRFMTIRFFRARNRHVKFKHTLHLTGGEILLQ